MTSNEIKQQAAIISERYTPRFDYDPKDDALADEIATLASALVVQAYEEAAILLDVRTARLRDMLSDQRVVRREIYDRVAESEGNATAIRTLKDQLSSSSSPISFPK